MAIHVVLESTPTKTLAEELNQFLENPPHGYLHLITIRSTTGEELSFSYIDKLLAIFKLPPIVVIDLQLQIQGVSLVPSFGEDVKNRLLVAGLILDDIPTFRHNPSYLPAFLSMFYHISVLKFNFGSCEDMSLSQYNDTIADLLLNRIPLDLPTGFRKLDVGTVDLGMTSVRDEPNGHLDCAIALYALAKVATCVNVRCKCYPRETISRIFEYFLSTCENLRVFELDVSRGSPRYFFREGVNSNHSPRFPSLSKLPPQHQLATVKISGFGVDLTVPHRISQNKKSEYAVCVSTFFQDVFNMIKSLSRPTTTDTYINCFLKLNTRGDDPKITDRVKNEEALFRLLLSAEPKTVKEPRPKPDIHRIDLEVLADGTWVEDLLGDKHPRGSYLKLRMAVFRAMGLGYKGDGLSLNMSAVKE